MGCHPASRVTLWVSHGKFASRTSFQGGLFFSSGGPFFSFRGASFFGMKNGNLHSGGHWPPWKRIASYQVNLWSELIVKLFFIIMQQRLDWILKFVFLSARFDNIFTKAQNIYIYLTLQGRGTSSLQLAATAKIGRAPLQKPCHLEGEGGWPPEGEEGAGEDRGGWVGNNHLLLEEDSVRGGTQGPSKAFAWPAGGDWPGSRGGCRAAQLFTQPGEDLGQPAKGWPAEQTPGEINFEAGAIQNWLIPKSAEKGLIKTHTKVIEKIQLLIKMKRRLMKSFLCLVKFYVYVIWTPIWCLYPKNKCFFCVKKGWLQEKK